MWRQYSSTNVECPGKAACPFGDVCFAEQARDKAKSAQLVITNHAIVALDLAADGQLLGDREAFVFDELHELDNYMSSAWGGELTYKRLESTHKLLKSIPSIEESNVEALKALLDDYDAALHSVEVGLLDNDDSSIKLENFLVKLYNTATKLSTDITRKAKDSNGDALKRIYTGAKKVADELVDIANALSTINIETVRWTSDSSKIQKRRGTATKAKAIDRKESGSTMSMHAAPLRIGPKLQHYLTEREAIMIGLSATVTVAGGFDIPIHNFGLENKLHKTVILDSPFDFKKQAMLYIPDPTTFPLPVGEDRFEHAKAVKEDSVDFINAAGGRTLVLSTTTYGVEEMSTHFRTKVKTPILAQGDAPNPNLVEEFKRVEEVSLVGTMGFWHGLDAPGPTLICVIVDKLPFPSPSDPLLLARKNYADKMGRNGFMEIYVTIADWMARQAFGRGVRSKTDKVVVVFYDVRLLTKNYGRAILNNLHGVGIYHDKPKVISALKRLRESVEK
jgi:ATP-dependent DNA helicase DinG